MTRQKNAFILSAIIALCCHSAVFGGGTTSADFLKLGAGARNGAMGDTGAADNSVNASWWNPAGLTQIPKFQCSFMYSPLFGGEAAFQHAALGKKYAFGAFALSAGILSVKPIDKYDNTGARLGETYAPQDSVIMFSFAKDVIDYRERIPVGISVKYVSSQLDDVSADTYAFDIGMFVHPVLFPNVRNLKVGVAVQNIGNAMKFKNRSYPLSQITRAGMTYTILGNSLIAADVYQCTGSDVSFGFGYEYYTLLGSMMLFSPRIGYKQQVTEAADALGVTLGFGLTYNRLVFDYAFIPYGELETVHKISVKFSMF
ncbi:MAG: PorV/PorQ family protein [Endomicrobiales bacterium]|nr:PorV/PorQ family protein [Endomicrobiales bacterium]